MPEGEREKEGGEEKRLRVFTHQLLAGFCLALLRPAKTTPTAHSNYPYTGVFWSQEPLVLFIVNLPMLLLLVAIPWERPVGSVPNGENGTWDLRS